MSVKVPTVVTNKKKSMGERFSVKVTGPASAGSLVYLRTRQEDVYGMARLGQPKNGIFEAVRVV